MIRTTACAAAILAGATGCSQDTRVAVLVVTPDGGDPFGPPDAATQARVTVEDRATPAVTVSVGRGGAFALDLTVAQPSQISRLVLEALAEGVVVGSGATPALAWGGLGPVILPVFVQRRDSLVLSPWSLGAGRTSPVLLTLAGGQHFAAALGGATTPSAIDVFDLLALANVSGGATLDGMYDRDASVITLASGGVLVVRGCAAVVWTPSTNQVAMPTQMPPSDRCNVLGSTAVAEPTGGGLLLGGHTVMGPTARVDQVMPDGTFTTVPALASPRDAPGVVRVGSFQVLVAGGQSGADPFLERWTPDLPAAMRSITTGMPRVDGRTGAVLVNAGGGIALALGGTVAGSTDLTAEDVVLDTGCLTGGCTVLVGTPVLVRQRRRGAVAALAEGGRVVVVGGQIAGGAVADQVELVDVSTPRMPAAAGSVASLPYPGMSALALETGSVMITGGDRREVWLYRH